MESPTEINVQLSTVNEPKNIKEIFSSWLDIGFKLGITLGAFISWAFFSFFVNTLPSLGSIGDIAIYLISISAWSLILAFYIVAISFASSFFIKISTYFNEYSSNMLASYYLIFTFLSFLILSILKVCEESNIVWNIAFIFLAFGIPLFYSLIFFQGISRKPWDRIGDIGLPLISFSLILLLIALIFDNWNNQRLTLIVFVIAIILLNVLIIKGLIKNSKTALFIVISYLVIVSIIFSMLKIDNPMIVKPFELLKLGHYKTELHFKDDFINKSNPFPLNETNQTSNTFFILSSVGDEYILRETLTSNDHNDSKTSNHNKLYPFDYNRTRYYCEDYNASLIWKVSDLNNTYIQKVKYKSHDFNKTVEQILTHWKTIDQKTYRIKKENIEFEVTGKDAEKQSTIWKINSSKKIIPKKDKDKHNKPPKKCIPNVTQTCY
jgi:hypothetical protein